MIELSDGSLYTGITNHIEHRLDLHKKGRGSKYVKSRLPIVALVYLEHVDDKSTALKREREIKKMRRNKKNKLLNHKCNEIKKEI